WRQSSIRLLWPACSRLRQKQYASILIRLRWSARSNTSRCNQSVWSQTWNLFCESSPTVLLSLAFANKLTVFMRELLLCPPDYYGIEYEINPWMSRARGAEPALAQKQWKQLHARLSNLDCEIHL